MISCDNLWNVMEEKGISQYALIRTSHQSGPDHPAEAERERQPPHTIEMFCKILNCEVGDIMRYIPDEEV